MYKQRAVLGFCWQGCHVPAIPAIPAKNSCNFACSQEFRSKKKKKNYLDLFLGDFKIISNVLE